MKRYIHTTDARRIGGIRAILIEASSKAAAIRIARAAGFAANATNTKLEGFAK